MMDAIRKQPSFTKRLVIMLILVGGLIGGLVWFNGFKTKMIKQFMAGMSEPPATVSTIIAQPQDWTSSLSAIGTLRAHRAVDLSPEISGSIRTLHIQSGDHVKAGQVLIEMNDDVERAQLRTLTAARDLAKVILDRDRKQLAIQTVPVAQVDADEADLKSKEAQLEAQSALITKKRILAPFTGDIGITTVAPGQYVNPGDKLANLQDLSNLVIDFSIPQGDFGKINMGAKVELKIDSVPDQIFHGVISARNPSVDASTRNLQVEAMIKNKHHRLLPGMFAQVNVISGDQHRYITLPQTAVAYNPYGSLVFVVKEDQGPDGKPRKVAQQVVVKTGPTRGDQIAILSGVSADTEVVSSGQLKVKNGTPLIINNLINPASDADPHPVDH
jgi:membrane fusion protein (multidrug efflux system)